MSLPSVDRLIDVVLDSVTLWLVDSSLIHTPSWVIGTAHWFPACQPSQEELRGHKWTCCYWLAPDQPSHLIIMQPYTWTKLLFYSMLFNYTIRYLFFYVTLTFLLFFSYVFSLCFSFSCVSLAVQVSCCGLVHMFNKDFKDFRSFRRHLTFNSSCSSQKAGCHCIHPLLYQCFGQKHLFTKSVYDIFFTGKTDALK